MTYINAVDGRDQVYDGFAVHGRTGPLARRWTRASPRAGPAGRVTAECIRSDLRVPVLVLQTETDQVLLGGGQVGQPDAGLLRNWELAGAAHADTYLMVASGHDDGALPAARMAELTRPTTRS